MKQILNFLLTFPRNKQRLQNLKLSNKQKYLKSTENVLTSLVREEKTTQEEAYLVLAQLLACGRLMKNTVGKNEVVIICAIRACLVKRGY